MKKKKNEDNWLKEETLFNKVCLWRVAQDVAWLFIKRVCV
jgi:hypothetical protein